MPKREREENTNTIEQTPAPEKNSAKRQRTADEYNKHTNPTRENKKEEQPTHELIKTLTVDEIVGLIVNLQEQHPEQFEKVLEQQQENVETPAPQPIAKKTCDEVNKNLSELNITSLSAVQIYNAALLGLKSIGYNPGNRTAVADQNGRIGYAPVDNRISPEGIVDPSQAQSKSKNAQSDPYQIPVCTRDPNKK